MNSTTTTIRIEESLKKEAVALLNDIGLNLSSAMTLFLKAVVRKRGIPFDLTEQKKGANPQDSSNNLKLNQAFLVKKDEFFTDYSDVEKELKFYSDAFENMVVFCNCDDPFESAFFRYFVLHFEELGIKKLISTCYATSGFRGSEYPVIGRQCAYKTEVVRVPDFSLLRHDESLDLKALFDMPENKLTCLKGDGDFRSEECKKLLKEADIVVTNPPFSLFREYISLLEKYKKKYVILGNMNASTCKEVFPLLKTNKVWYGLSIRSGDRKFFVPNDYSLYATGCGVDERGKKFIRVKGVRWFTNIVTETKTKPLLLNSVYSPQRYPTYENYDAIEVSKVNDIPKDYDGVMGVPITFLDKYCPDQFEILMLANGNARTNTPSTVLEKVKYKIHSNDRGGAGIVDGKRVYARILIRRKKICT